MKPCVFIIYVYVNKQKEIKKTTTQLVKKAKISAEEEDEEASRSAEDSWGPHPSIHCSHCFHSCSDSGRKLTKTSDRGKDGDMNASSYRISAPGFFPPAPFSRFCSLSDLKTAQLPWKCRGEQPPIKNHDRPPQSGGEDPPKTKRRIPE